MASRALVLTALLLVLFLLLIDAHADVGRRTNPVHRKLRQKTAKPPGMADVGRPTKPVVHRNLWRKSKPPESTSRSAEFSVDSYGAIGDGEHDDTESFQKAWAAARASSQPITLLVPRGKSYFLGPISFSGQCKSKIAFKLEGTLVAPTNRSTWPKESIRRWITFNNVNDLTVTGDGTTDGKGEIWWKNSCRVNKHLTCMVAPTALTLHKCNNLKVEDIKLLNSQQMHMSVEDCNDVTLSNLTISAPGDSPNTDGIHIALSSDVRVMHCDIKTGDDCISIETGTKDLYASDITCGPGHGISIGSLGDDLSEAEVSNITIHKAYLSGTTNGARIKSWQGGRGYARDITFENIIIDNVKNPIIIDQNYCTVADPLNPKPCEPQISAVEVSNVHFKNIRGTSATKDAIKLDCSSTIPCHDVTFQDVKLSFKGGETTAATSICHNVKLSKLVNVNLGLCVCLPRS